MSRYNMKTLIFLIVVNILIHISLCTTKVDEVSVDKKLEKIEDKFETNESLLKAALAQKSGDHDGAGSSAQFRYHNASLGIGVDATTNEKGFSNETVLPRNCYEIWESGIRQSGVYLIKPDLSKKPFKVLCDMVVQGGGWTHIQRRLDGHIDFYRGWRDYNFGFGYLDDDGEFWMGLQNIYALTDQQANQLLIEIVDRQGDKAFALYDNFAIGHEEDAYPLKTLSGFRGDAGDALSYHLNMKFSSFDLDQDNSTDNCAQIFQGAWWYNNCHTSNLNGKFVNINLPDSYKYLGLHWKTFHSLEYCHAQARMLIKPTKL